MKGLSLTVLLKRTLQQGGIKQRLQPVEILLLLGIRPTRPLLEMKANRTMQQPNGINVQLELEGRARICHEPIFMAAALDANNQMH